MTQSEKTLNKGYLDDQYMSSIFTQYTCVGESGVPQLLLALLILFNLIPT